MHELDEVFGNLQITSIYADLRERKGVKTFYKLLLVLTMTTEMVH